MFVDVGEGGFDFIGFKGFGNYVIYFGSKIGIVLFVKGIGSDGIDWYVCMVLCGFLFVDGGDEFCIVQFGYVNVGQDEVKCFCLYGVEGVGVIIVFGD